MAETIAVANREIDIGKIANLMHNVILRSAIRPMNYGQLEVEKLVREGYTIIKILDRREGYPVIYIIESGGIRCPNPQAFAKHNLIGALVYNIDDMLALEDFKYSPWAGKYKRVNH